MKKKLMAALPLLFLFCHDALCETIPASDGRITYIGRTRADNRAVSFDWTGVYLRVRFQGTSLSFKVSDTNKDYYNVWLDSSMDRTPDKVIAVHGSDTTIVIFSAEELRGRFGKDRKAARSPHQVILQKRTEGNQGRTTIGSFTTDGVFLRADPPKDRAIEFIGDSYTCGYGTEASNKEHFSPETENQNLTYACATARYFGAEQMVTAHSGMGITRNYNGKNTDDNMVSHYLRTFDTDPEVSWDPKTSEVKPDITVIYLGTNDFSTQMQPAERVFVRNYIQLLKEIKDFYGPGHPVLCMAPKHDPLILGYIRKAVETCGLTDIHLLGLGPSVHNNDGDMGADGHPAYGGHRKIAYSLIPYISTVTGWEIDDNGIK
jgi:lysophospholipase L1-like esterase